eukprot:7421612-Ditylum_brightwellii.AAC.1
MMLRDIEGHDWKDIGKWTLEEIILLGLVEREKMPTLCTLPEITFDCITALSSAARSGMTEARTTMALNIGSFIYSARQRLQCQAEYEFDAASENDEDDPKPLALRPLHEISEFCDEEETDVPLLVKNSREEVTKDGKVKIFGPQTIGAYEGHQFEVWTASNDGDDKVNSSPEVCTSGKKPVTVIIGTPNNSFETAVHALERVLLHRETVLIKHNSLREYLYDPYYIILGPLIRRGYVQQVLDKHVPSRTKFLSHPRVGRVHVAGTQQTITSVAEELAVSRPSLQSGDIHNMISTDHTSVIPAVVSPGTYSE